MEEKIYKIDSFLDEIKSHRNDNSYLAKMSRGINKKTQFQAWELVVPYCSFSKDSKELDLLCFIGGFAAIAIKNSLWTEKRLSLGETMKFIYEKNGITSLPNLLKRIVLARSQEELLKYVFSVLKTSINKKESINFKSLYFDLNSVNNPEKWEKVKISWVHDFYKKTVGNLAEDKEKV